MRRLARLATCVASLGLLVPCHNAWAQQNGNGNGSGYNWSGFYGGGNAGGAFGGSDFLSGLGRGFPFFEGEVYTGFPNAATPGIIAAYRSNDVDVRSFTGGFQGGYNFWGGGVLLGIEADINFLNAKKSKTTQATGLAPDPTTYTFTNEIDASYIASLRSRVGIPLAGGILFATGGVAMTTLKYEHSFRATGGFFNGIFENASASETKAGWTLGGGYELPIGPGVTLKTEYLFTHFGNVTTNDNKITPLGGFGTPVAMATFPAIAEVPCGADTGQLAVIGAPVTPRQCFNHKADLILHSIRLGLNFKF